VPNPDAGGRQRASLAHQERTHVRPARDVSRGKVPTLETLQGIVDVIALYKLNMLMLYVEHTFAFRSHPLIGCGWGCVACRVWW